MKDHIFSSIWIYCCISRSQITNHKITFSGGRSITESCKLWHMELLLKSGLCSSATFVHDVGSVQASVQQLHLRKSTLHCAFYFTILSQGVRTAAKVIFWGVLTISLDCSINSV